MFHSGNNMTNLLKMWPIPSYYTTGSIKSETIRDQELNYHLGNAIKYIAELVKPDDTAAKDLAKAIHYLQNELQHHMQQASREFRTAYGLTNSIENIQMQANLITESILNSFMLSTMKTVHPH